MIRHLKILILLGVLFTGLGLSTSGNVFADAGEISVGVAAISPNGITAKYWMSDELAVDLFAKWNINSDKFNIHMDLLHHDWNSLAVAETPLGFYYGFGVRTKGEENKDTQLGARLPLGVTMFTDFAPLDLFAEVAPRVNITPSTNFGMDLMIGIRYRFFTGN